MGLRSYLPVVSPVGAPRVLHNPVGYPILFSIPNSQYCVVYFIWSFMTGSTGKEIKKSGNYGKDRSHGSVIPNHGSSSVLGPCFPWEAHQVVNNVYPRRERIVLSSFSPADARGVSEWCWPLSSSVTPSVPLKREQSSCCTFCSQQCWARI